MKPFILITNDDGIHAPGLYHLWKTLSKWASIAIVAPAEEQSGKGLAITTRNPLFIQESKNFESTPAWSVTGTPADCVKIGLHSLVSQKPDVVVSGINNGSNAGRNILYSGTVGAAIEATFQEVPAIAFSSVCWKNPNFQLSTDFLKPIVEHVLSYPLPKGSLVNVNFPSDSIKGIKWTKQGRGLFSEAPERRFHPSKEAEYFWLGLQAIEFEEHEDTDISWINKGYGAVVPIHVDVLTDLNHYESHRLIFEQTFDTKIYEEAST